MTLNRLFPLLALLCLTLSYVSEAIATGTRGIVIEPGNRNTSNRLALVIGNDYDGESGKLQNPVNDADDMRKTLTKLGFEVMGDNQQNLEDMNALVREFGDRLRPGMVGLFYFAGHGMQINGQNYLVPAQSGIQREDEVPFRALAVDQILAKMGKNKTGLNLMMLDACRDNPFARSFRSTTTGLAKMEAPSGTLISYAAKPGTRSIDGTGHNGLYTSVLLKYLPIQGMPIEQMLKKVGTEVRQRSGDQQQTWMEGLLDSGDGGDFCFAGCAGRVLTPIKPPYRPLTPEPSITPARQSRPIPQTQSPIKEVRPKPRPTPLPTKDCDDCPDPINIQNHDSGMSSGGLKRRLVDLSSEERDSIEMVCNRDKYQNGPAAYDQCLTQHLASLDSGIKRPDLTGLSSEERDSIEMVCNRDKYQNGPAAYNECLNQHLASRNSGIKRPDLSVLSSEERDSIEMACNRDKYQNGPAAYNQCLENQVSNFRGLMSLHGVHPIKAKGAMSQNLCDQKKGREQTKCLVELQIQRAR